MRDVFSLTVACREIEHVLSVVWTVEEFHFSLYGRNGSRKWLILIVTLPLLHPPGDIG